ncbi:MAG: hypothetical protein E7242_05990 [Lachnospiraceae bacterium]|nr:hypothetical protein [Lachnospiraceae bacterium]
MKKTKMQLIKRICAILTLVLITAMPSLFNGSTLVVMAADETGVFTFKLPESYLDEVYGTQIDIRMYKLADYTENVGFTSLPAYESLNFESISGTTTAKELAIKALETAEFLNVSKWDDNDSRNADKEISFKAGEEPEISADYGLYLICIKDFKSVDNNYVSLPYLLSMPTFEEIPGQGVIADDSPSVTLKITKLVPTNNNSNPDTNMNDNIPVSSNMNMEVLTGDSIMKLVIPSATIAVAALVIVIAIALKRKMA